MSPKERHAYRLGFLRARRKARKELYEMAQRLDDEFVELALLGEMRQARDEEAIKRALVERATHLDGWLH